jgi:outer membrane protein OmpA-like peptidoglycan-associated protein
VLAYPTLLEAKWGSGGFFDPFERIINQAVWTAQYMSFVRARWSGKYKKKWAGTLTGTLGSEDMFLRKDFWSKQVSKTEVARMRAHAPKQVLLDFDSDVIKKADRDAFVNFGTMLAMTPNPTLTVYLVGHALSPGRKKYNKALSR